MNHSHKVFGDRVLLCRVGANNCRSCVRISSATHSNSNRLKTLRIYITERYNIHIHKYNCRSIIRVNNMELTDNEAKAYLVMKDQLEKEEKGTEKEVYMKLCFGVFFHYTLL